MSATNGAAAQSAVDRALEAFDSAMTPTGAYALEIRDALDALAEEFYVAADASDLVAAGMLSGIEKDLRDLALKVTERRRSIEGPDRPRDDALPSFRPLLDVDPNAEIAWLVHELLIAGDLALLAGPDGHMKTTIAEAIGLACAGGYSVFGRFKAQACPVLFISGEDPEGVLRNRADALCRGHGWDAERVLGNIHVLALAGVDMKAPLWQQHILTAVDRLKPGLVIFDPLAELATGDENSNPERGILVRAFRQICAASGATVLIVHHFKKAADGVAKDDLIRGGNALKNASRATYTLEKSPDGGIIVECVKFSRAAKRAKFVVRPQVVADEKNEAMWSSARLDYVSVQEATLDASHAFVLDQLAGGARLTTTDLKNAAKGTGISGADISRALKVLEMQKAIDFEPGEKGAKRWGLCLPGKLGNQKSEVAGQPECLPGNQTLDDSCLPAPFRGQPGKQDRNGAGQAGSEVAA